MKRKKPPLELKRANIYGDKSSDASFDLVDPGTGRRVAREKHRRASDDSIDDSARKIIGHARSLKRSIRTKGGFVIRPVDEDDEEG